MPEPIRLICIVVGLGAVLLAIRACCRRGRLSCLLLPNLLIAGLPTLEDHVWIPFY